MRIFVDNGAALTEVVDNIGVAIALLVAVMFALWWVLLEQKKEDAKIAMGLLGIVFAIAVIIVAMVMIQLAFFVDPAAHKVDDVAVLFIQTIAIFSACLLAVGVLKVALIRYA